MNVFVDIVNLSNSSSIVTNSYASFHMFPSISTSCVLPSSLIFYKHTSFKNCVWLQIRHGLQFFNISTCLPFLHLTWHLISSYLQQVYQKVWKVRFYCDVFFCFFCIVVYCMQWLISFFPYAFIVANYYALINSHVSFHMSCVFLSLFRCILYRDTSSFFISTLPLSFMVHLYFIPSHAASWFCSFDVIFSLHALVFFFMQLLFYFLFALAFWFFFSSNAQYLFPHACTCFSLVLLNYLLSIAINCIFLVCHCHVHNTNHICLLSFFP